MQKQVILVSSRKIVYRDLLFTVESFTIRFNSEEDIWNSEAVQFVIAMAVREEGVWSPNFLSQLVIAFERVIGVLCSESQARIRPLLSEVHVHLELVVHLVEIVSSDHIKRAFHYYWLFLFGKGSNP